MLASVHLYSKEEGELNRFLGLFYNTDFDIQDHLSWQKEYKNPVELAEIVGTFIDNCEDFNLSMWICLDKNVYVHITKENADNIIKYLYERFPY